LSIEGWYRHISNSSLARWQNSTKIPLNSLVAIETTDGLPSDLYNEICEKILPYIDDYDLNELYFNSDLRQYFFEQLKLNLTAAVNFVYNTTFHSFYIPKQLFVYNSSDFTLVNTSLGNFLVAQIPYLNVNETKVLSWSLNNIPTSRDRFGVYIIRVLKDSNGNNYLKFSTCSSDYKLLMKLLLALSNNSGRFLSVYDNTTDYFISHGSRFVFYDKNGRDYYGVTNGINFQLEDDEAVLESILQLEQTSYKIGERIALDLSIINHGSIAAHNVTINIINVQLDSLWQPKSLIPVKTISLPVIDALQSFNHTLVIKANNHVGFNAYLALISFISDKGQGSEVLVDPWTETTVEWSYAGEAKNIVTSTLAFGICLPPKNLVRKERPALPLPELKTEVKFYLNKEEKSLKLEYTIENVGLSSTNVSISKIYNDTYHYIHDLNATYSTKGNSYSLSIQVSTEEFYTQAKFETIQLNPGDKIVITEEYKNLDGKIYVSPIIVTYTSQYFIYHTDFDNEGDVTKPMYTTISAFFFEAPYSTSYFSSLIKEVTESEQENFNWTSYSQLFLFDFSSEVKIEIPTFISISYYYPLITLTVFTAITLIIALASRKKR